LVKAAMLGSKMMLALGLLATTLARASTE